MEITYKNNRLWASLTTDKGILKNYGKNAKKVKQRINELTAANTLLDISSIPAMRLHPLIGDEKGTWTIDIHKNWRICFEIDHAPIPKHEDGGVDLSLVTNIKILSVKDTH